MNEVLKTIAAKYKDDIVHTASELIQRNSQSLHEGEVAAYVQEKMKELGYDKVEFDKLGNVIGWMGEGDKIIAIDSHIDTVGIGNIENWESDPYQGYETDDIIYGRGGSDQEGGMAAAAYGVKIMKDLDLVHVMPVAEFQDIVIAGNRFSELQNRTLSLEELCMHPLVSMESGTTTRLFWDNLFEEQGLDLRPSIEVSSNDLIAPTVSHNLGIGFVPSEFARNYLLNYRVFQLHLNIPIPKRQILVLQNPMRPLTPAAQAFLDMLKQPVQESIGNEQPVLLHP